MLLHGKMKLQILVAVFLVVSVYGRPRNEVVEIPRWSMDSIECDICEVIVRDIRATILGREKQVIQSVVERCEANFFFRMLDCSAVASLLTPLLDKLTLSPETICRGLNFCTNSKHTAPELIVSGLDGVEGMSVMSQGSTQGGHTEGSYHQKFEQDFQCQLCESMVTIFYDTVTHQATWKDIARLINPLCKYYPHKDRCHGYIDRLPDEAFSFAVEFLNKEVDCKFLGFCSADKSTLRTTGTASSNVQCEVCEGIVMVLHDTVACSDTWTDLATILLPKCAAFPVPEQCKAFLNGLPAMMKTVADKYLNKETDCSQYCTNPPPEQVFLGTASTTTQCDLCQGVVTVLHDGIACSSTWTDLANMLLPKCADYPVPEQCKEFLNDLPAMMKTLVDKYLNKETDCAKFCTNPPEQVILGIQSTDDDSGCGLCKTFIALLYDLLTNTATWKDISNLLIATCKHSPAPEECTVLLHGHLNQDADCSRFGFCTSNSTKLFLGTGSSDTLKCDLCKGFVTALHDAIACTDTWTDIADMLLPKCEDCPVPEQCKAFLNDLPAMMKTVSDVYLNSETDCAKFCTNPPNPKQVFFPTVSSGTVQCDLCQGIVTVLHDAIACSDTWTDIANMLLPKCADCPVPKQCKAFLNGLPVMMKTLADKYLVTETDCARYCTNPPPEQVLLGTAPSTKCHLCQGLVTVLHDTMACSDVWADIATMLLPKCADCPVPEQCKAFLNSLPAMMKTVADTYLNKDMDCAKYCTHPPPEQVFLHLLSNTNASSCEMCKNTISLVYSIFTSTVTWEEISHLLMPTCKRCPVPTKCRAFLKTLPAKMQTVADGYLNADTDCTMFHFCTSDNSTAFIDVLTEPDRQRCELCKSLITGFSSILTSTSKWNDIASMLNRTCKYWPFPDQCTTLVNGLPDILQTFADGHLNPIEDCKFFGFCSTSSERLFFHKNNSEVRKTPSQPDEIQCTICKALASTGQRMVTQVITDKLTKYLTKWCKTLTSQAMRTQCAEDIAVVLPPLMVKFLKDMLNVNTLCVDLLHACSEVPPPLAN